MAHKDIYTKFMIEYDKANVTSSYPSLTQFEVATLLDKAYDSVVDRKFTGLNNRKSFFESDIKSIQDLQSLIKKSIIDFDDPVDDPYQDELNVHYVNVPSDMLYFVAAGILLSGKSVATILNDNTETITSKYVSAALVTHRIAENFFTTLTNKPWIPTPLCFLEGDRLGLVYDLNHPIDSEHRSVYLTYLRKHNPFVKNISDIKNAFSEAIPSGGDIPTDKLAFLSFKLDRYNCSYEPYLNPTTQNTEHRYYMTGSGNIHTTDIDITGTISNMATYCIMMVVDKDFNEREVSATNFLMSRPTYNQSTSLWEHHQYFEHDVHASWINHDDEFDLQIDEKLIILGFSIPSSIDPGSLDPWDFEDVVAVSTLFSLTYDNLKLLLENKKLLAGKQVYICSRNLSQDDSNSSVYEFLTPGSFSILKYSKKTLCKFDSTSSHNSVIKSFTYDQRINIDKLWDHIKITNFDYVADNDYIWLLDYINTTEVNNTTILDLYTFELSDSMASEVISTAITYALDNVESTRLQSHSSLMTLEA